MGDFGTLLPLAIGFMAVNNMHPAGFLVVFGLTNIATGLIYGIPLPLQPMKVIAATAIAQAWAPSLISATALSMGLFWLLMGALPGVERLVQKTPDGVIRGIQLALGLNLAWSGLRMATDNSWWLGLLTVSIIWTLNRNQRAMPTALVVILLGVVTMVWQGTLPELELTWTARPTLSLPVLSLAWEGFWRAGIGQIPLTLANAVVACLALIKDFFPESDISERHLMFNMGAINVVSSVFGGFPMCHGAGGLASQYYFGARTGGANIMEGTIELVLGLFLAGTLLQFFRAFPVAIVGGMMVVVGVELGKLTHGVARRSWLVTVGTVLPSLFLNMGVGFVCGLAVHIVSENLHRFKPASH